VVVVVVVGLLDTRARSLSRQLASHRARGEATLWGGWAVNRTMLKGGGGEGKGGDVGPLLG
tara:strand:- start:1033 stop:1215 length:183 start_codon:yes stop_codon:yes gene_type:complete